MTKIVKCARIKIKDKSIRNRGSSVVSALASGARGLRFIPAHSEEKFRCLNTFSLVSFARNDTK